MRLFALVACLVVGVAYADWQSTRETTYDWACFDGATLVSSHQRQDTAFAACSNLTLKDGKARQVKGGTYRITATVTPPPAGSATLSWTPPTLNTDGTALTNLAGYRIHYGTSATALTQAIQVANPSLTTYVVESLAPGTYYFAVRAYTPTAESTLTNTVSKVIQ